jgi:hypothetical protein
MYVPLLMKVLLKKYWLMLRNPQGRWQGTLQFGAHVFVDVLQAGRFFVSLCFFAMQRPGRDK